MTVKPYNTGQTKKEEVREMFDNIAPKYDLLNHTLSMNIDRIWRRHVVRIVREMARTIKPGGKVVILEFSRPRNRLFRVLYEFYTYKILPRIGGMVSKDKRAYEYLPASVGEFPAPAEFMSMMERAGFRGCRARSQSFGIAQIYTGQR